MAAARGSLVRGVALGAGLLALAAGCSNPVMPPRDNPLDPDGTNYYHPGIELLAGPIDDSIIHQTDVTYRWRGTGRAEAFNWRMDGENWRGWTAQDSAPYHFLDEGRHKFTVYAKAQYGEADPPKEFSFQVHTIDGPALRVYPWHFTASYDNYVSVELLVKGVGRLSKARFVMAYDSTALRYSTIYPHPGCWPSPIIADSSRPGLIDYRIQQYTGGGGTVDDTLVLLMMTTRTPNGLDSLTFLGTTTLWDISGNPVSLSTVRGCWITSGP